MHAPSRGHWRTFAAAGPAALALTIGLALPAPAGAQAPARWACDGESESYALAALRSPFGAERAATPQAEALRAYLAASPRLSDGSRLPRTGWRLLAQGAERATFGSRLFRFGILTITAVREDGVWRADSAYDCELVRVGLTPFGLRSPAVVEGGRVLRAGIDVSGCARPRRVLGMSVRAVTTRRSVTVRLRVRMTPRPAPPPGVSCPDIGFEKFIRIRLPRPVGDRAIYDGSRRPKRLLRARQG